MKDKIIVWRLLVIILDKIIFEINPPEDMTVKAKLNESRSLMLIKLNKKIIKMVHKK